MAEVEEIKAHVNPVDYFSKMTPEDAATITTMCLDQICKKAQELKDLSAQLAKTYPFEMGVCNITCIVQVSANKLPIIPVLGLLGTSDGIKNGLAKLTVQALKLLAEKNKEEQSNDDKEQG